MRSLPIALNPASRMVPHIVDTLFLATAVWMIVLLGQAPVSAAWLAAKLSGLVTYILLGVVAMRSAPGKRLSIPFFVAALAVFAWVVSVALSKAPLGFLH